MIDYIMVYPTGQIVASGIVQDECLQFITPISGTQIIPNQLAQPDTGYYYDFETNSIKPIPQKPDGFYKWDFDTHEWVLDYEAASADVIAKRDKALLDSDWTQLPDVPLTQDQKNEWATYRQELRDIPQQSGYPYNVVWPVAPTS